MARLPTRTCEASIITVDRACSNCCAAQLGPRDFEGQVTSQDIVTAAVHFAAGKGNSALRQTELAHLPISSFQRARISASVTGLLLFGLSTALMFAVMQHLIMNPLRHDANAQPEP
jgi:hypothetical protein